MKYNVECSVRDKEQISGTKPYDPMLTDNYVNDYIDVENANEAIIIAINNLYNSIIDNGYSAIKTKKNIIVFDDEDNKIMEYYNFIARRVK